MTSMYLVLGEEDLDLEHFLRPQHEPEPNTVMPLRDLLSIQAQPSKTPNPGAT